MCVIVQMDLTVDLLYGRVHTSVCVCARWRRDVFCFSFVFEWGGFVRNAHFARNVYCLSGMAVRGSVGGSVAARYIE